MQSTDIPGPQLLDKMPVTGIRLRFIDGLRGLAMLMVLFYHLPLITTPTIQVPAWAAFTSYGGSGIILFFVISAFSLCHTMPSHQRTGVMLYSFFVKRFFRIAPLFYVLLASQLLVEYMDNGTLPAVDIIVANLLFLFNFYPKAIDCLIFAGWTLGVEWAFYLIFPCLHRNIQSLSQHLAFFIVSFAAFPIFMGLIGYLHLSPHEEARTSLLTIFLYLPAFAGGMLTYQLYQRAELLPRDKGLGLVFMAGALVLFTLLVSGKLRGVLPPAHWETFCFVLLVLGSAYYGVSAPAGRVNLRVSCAASLSRILSFYGTISFSAYLLHGPIIKGANPLFQWINEWETPATLRFVVSGILALLLVTPASLLSYHLIERPGITFARHIVGIRSGRKDRKAVPT